MKECCESLTSEMDCREIGNIGNYYGGLSVKMESGKCYWSIEGYSGHNWEQIARSLFDALVHLPDESKPIPLANEMMEAWHLLNVLCLNIMDDGPTWPRVLEWLRRNEQFRPDADIQQNLK